MTCECSICWSIREICPISCEHSFCGPCLQKHFKRDVRCPICRNTIYYCVPLTSFSEKNTYEVVVNNIEMTGTGLGVSMSLINGNLNITRVKRYSLAYKKKIHKGDTMLAINNIPTSSIESVQKILKTPRTEFTLLFNENKPRKKCQFLLVNKLVNYLKLIVK